MASDPAARPEPVLGDLQRSFVDAVTTRLWSGVPMNEHDHAMADWLARFLNLEPAELLGENQARLLDATTRRIAALPPPRGAT